MNDKLSLIRLPDDWPECVVADGVSKDLPGIYEWKIEGAGTYIGKYKHIGRQLKEYRRNVRIF